MLEDPKQTFLAATGTAAETSFLALITRALPALMHDSHWCTADAIPSFIMRATSQDILHYLQQRPARATRAGPLACSLLGRRRRRRPAERQPSPALLPYVPTQFAERALPSYTRWPDAFVQDKTLSLPAAVCARIKDIAGQLGRSFSERLRASAPQREQDSGPAPCTTAAA